MFFCSWNLAAFSLILSVTILQKPVEFNADFIK